MTLTSLRNQIADRCIHFNGILNDTCKAGVPYAMVRNLPCFRSNADWKSDACAKCEMPSEEYIALRLAEIEESDQRMAKVAGLVAQAKAAHPNEDEDWEIVEICPVCGGKLTLSYAGYNNHLWGKCETTNCLAWME